MTEPALLHRLAAADSQLHARLHDLRESVNEWLGYIPTTFPHYTRHSIAHSDEIIKQLSGLMFVDSDPDRPVSAFSNMELYVLAASAYLHDAGMVVSDAEKAELLVSTDWAEWTLEGPASARWQAIQEIRRQADEDSESAPQLHFAADLQTRFLIAEYVRRNHHLRAAELLEDQPTLLSRADLDDPSLRRTIADVCLGHGLSRADLAMDERYPTRRDIQGSPVDVRFMAILLRLGDLLDLSHDRGCPLLLNAASPLPPGSIAHWKQYQRIVHRVTSPDRLELRAECDTQEEHRLLRDWCQWIEDEARDAQFLMRQSDRHKAWNPPLARLGDPDRTFTIKPSALAKYVPVDWRIESDPATVLSRFASDIYSSNLSFVRELIQNALDASRCRVFAELGPKSQSDGWWTSAALEVCQKFPIEVKLERRVKNDGDIEEVNQVISVSDRGIGMDAERIQQYLLHAGRSFYDSPSFRKQYGFVAASRFGVGFLSVFGVSDHVEVLTRAMDSESGDGIRLELRGPRNYVLVESADQDESGTTVSVELREQIDPDQLLQALTSWCTRCEFPVRVSVEDESTTIRQETPDKFEVNVSVDAGGVSSFEVLSFPVSSPVARGEIYVVQQTSSDGRSRWDINSYELQQWVEKHAPMLPVVPEAPSPMLALHGIETASHWGHGMSVRIDVRASQAQRRLNLARERSIERLPTADLGIDEDVERLLGDHFSATTADRRYRAQVVRVLEVPWRIASKIPDMVEIWSHEGATKGPSKSLWSWSELEAQPEVGIVYGKGVPEAELAESDIDALTPLQCLMGRSEIRWSSFRYGDDGIDLRPLDFSCSPDGKWYVVRYEPTKSRSYQTIAISLSDSYFESDAILIACGTDTSSLDTFFLNRDHPLVKELSVVSARELGDGERLRVNWTRSGPDPSDTLDLFLVAVRGALSSRYGQAEIDITSTIGPFVEAVGQAQGAGRYWARSHGQHLLTVHDRVFS